MEILENNFGKVRCPECDSVFRITDKGDFVWDPHDDNYYIKCPICGQLKWFEEDDPYVQHYIHHQITHR